MPDTDTQTVILETWSRWQQPSTSTLLTNDLLFAVLKRCNVDRDKVLQQQGVNSRTALYYNIYRLHLRSAKSCTWGSQDCGQTKQPKSCTDLILACGKA